MQHALLMPRTDDARTLSLLTGADQGTTETLTQENQTSKKSSGVEAASTMPICESLCQFRKDEVLACWLMSEVPGADVLLSRAGVRPDDF